jgi:hypothetical protein
VYDSSRFKSWTKEEIMAYVDWDKAETDRIEAQVAKETDNGRLASRRRGMAVFWERAEQDFVELKALYSAAA